jgi:hypothetical protein
MFGNREVCIGLSVAVEMIPIVQIMQLVPHFVKRFTGHIDTLSPALYSSPRRDDQPCSTRSDSCVEREAGSAPLRLLLTAQPANPLFPLCLDHCGVLPVKSFSGGWTNLVFSYLAGDSFAAQGSFQIKSLSGGVCQSR